MAQRKLKLRRRLASEVARAYSRLASALRNYEAEVYGAGVENSFDCYHAKTYALLWERVTAKNYDAQIEEAKKATAEKRLQS